MPNYGAGDEVWCVDSTDQVRFFGPILGQKFPVLAMKKCERCGAFVVDVGLRWPVSSKCICGNSLKGTWLYSWRFIKLDKLETEQTSEKISV